MNHQLGGDFTSDEAAREIFNCIKQVVQTLLVLKTDDEKNDLLILIFNTSWEVYMDSNQILDEISDDDRFEGVAMELCKNEDGLWVIRVEKAEAPKEE